MIEQVDSRESLTISWLGHACFRLDWQRPTGPEMTVLFDPFPAKIGYPAPQVHANVVLITHPHLDHASLPSGGAPLVIRGVSEDGKDWRRVNLELRGLNISGIACYHDETLGSGRGKNMGYKVSFGDIAVAHLGDVGHRLSQRHIDELKGLDLLFIPTGGHYTIDGRTAREMMDAIRPKVTVPMHYLTDRISNWPIEPVDAFLDGREYRRVPGPVTVTADELPTKPEIWVFDTP